MNWKELNISAKYLWQFYMLLKKADDSYTRNYFEAIKEILEYHLPFDHTDVCKFVNNNDEFYNSEIKKNEIRKVIKELDINKAPGCDNINDEIIQMMYNTKPGAFVEIYNMIWETGKHPHNWKLTGLALIPKEGKDPSLVSDYRPICLLSIRARYLIK